MFPIAVQAPPDYRGNEPSADLQLVAELLEVAVDTMAKLAAGAAGGTVASLRLLAAAGLFPVAILRSGTNCVF
jgi:hypothetical protein